MFFEWNNSGVMKKKLPGVGNIISSVFEDPNSIPIPGVKLLIDKNNENLYQAL